VTKFNYYHLPCARYIAGIASLMFVSLSYMKSC